MEPAQEIVKVLESANAGHRMLLDVFADFCRVFALTLEAPLTIGKLRDEIEGEYGSVMKRYDNNVQAFATCMAITVKALDSRREEFLGRVHEEIGAANTRNGQFFTPPSVANVMARVTTPDVDYTPGEPVVLNDPACGASVTLIAGAEALLGRGIPQRDILVDAGDIDLRALDMSYVELSLLGYAAVIRHENALTREILSRPRFTPGYFFHSFPMRGWKLGRKPSIES